MINILCLTIAITVLISINMPLLADDIDNPLDTTYHSYEGTSKYAKATNEFEVFEQYISDQNIKAIHMSQYGENQWYDNIIPKAAKIDRNDVKLAHLSDLSFTLSNGGRLYLGKEFIIEASEQSINKWMSNGGKKFPLGVFVNNKNMSIEYVSDNLFGKYFNTVTYEVFLLNIKQGYTDPQLKLNSYPEDGLAYKFLYIYNMDTSESKVELYNKIKSQIKDKGIFEFFSQVRMDELSKIVEEIKIQDEADNGTRELTINKTYKTSVSLIPEGMEMDIKDIFYGFSGKKEDELNVLIEDLRAYDDLGNNIYFKLSKQAELIENKKLKIEFDSTKSNEADIGTAFIYLDNKWTISKVFIKIIENKLHINQEESQEVDKSKIKTDSYMKLINRYHPIKDYKNPNMENIKDIKAKLQYKNMQLDKTVITELRELMNKAYTEGYKSFYINSAYRSYKEQDSLFNRGVAYRTKLKIKNAYEVTWARCALPGTSEHQSGLAVDVLSTKAMSSSVFEGSKEAEWLGKNCWDFGFIVRYPKNKTEFTKTIYEPWHIRYVGKPLATYLQVTGICFEELYEKITNEKLLTLEKSDEPNTFLIIIKNNEKLLMNENSIKIHSSSYLTDEDMIMYMEIK